MSRPKNRTPNRDKRARPGVRTKIYVRDDMIGSGKIDLLREIDAAGSISGAARAMGLGYRRAWFLLDTIQRCFATPLVETSSTGARLTPLGADLIARYDAHIAEIEAASAGFLDWLEEHQAEETSVEPDRVA